MKYSKNKRKVTLQLSTQNGMQQQSQKSVKKSTAQIIQANIPAFFSTRVTTWFPH
jgi:hypothetical protein